MFVEWCIRFYYNHLPVKAARGFPNQSQCMITYKVAARDRLYRVNESVKLEQDENFLEQDTRTVRTTFKMVIYELK